MRYLPLVRKVTSLWNVTYVCLPVRPSAYSISRTNINISSKFHLSCPSCEQWKYWFYVFAVIRCVYLSCLGILASRRVDCVGGSLQEYAASLIRLWMWSGIFLRNVGCTVHLDTVPTPEKCHAIRRSVADLSLRRRSQSVWDLWWTKWYCEKYFLSCTFLECSIHI